MSPSLEVDSGRLKGVIMAKKRYTAEQIIQHLREAEILLSQGQTVREIVRKLAISEQTYYRWRKEYGGMDVSLTCPHVCSHIQD